MPVLVQSFRVLPGKDQFVTRSTSRFEVFCVMPLTEDFVIEHAVSEINKNFITCGTSETGWMPMSVESKFGSHHGHASSHDDFLTFQTY